MNKLHSLVFLCTRYVAIVSLTIVTFYCLYEAAYVLAFTTLLVTAATLISFSQLCFSYGENLEAAEQELRQAVKYMGEKFFVAALWLSVAAVIASLYLVQREFSNMGPEWDFSRYFLLGLVLINFSYGMFNLHASLSKSSQIFFRSV